MRETTGNLNDKILHDGVLTENSFGNKKFTKNRKRCCYLILPIMYLGTSYMFFYLGRYLGNSECLDKQDGSL